MASTTTFAESYDDTLGPVIFRPWARELIARAKPKDGEHILDLACGTGIVSREIIAAGIRPASLTGIDISPDMLAVARSRTYAPGIDTEWHVADAGNLPVADGRFNVALCQQAFQFFPDKPAALAELHRVLAPGGRVAFCIQREIEVNPMLNAQAVTLEKFAGPGAASAVRAICGLSDRETIRDLFTSGGFQGVAVESVSLTLHHPDARAYAKGAMGGMHTGDKMAGLPAEKRKAAYDMFCAELGDCFDGIAMTFPHVSHVVTAHK